MRHEDAIAWLRDIAAGRASLAVSADSTSSLQEGGPRVQTGSVDSEGTIADPRGW
jgi:hypothetical protein